VPVEIFHRKTHVELQPDCVSAIQKALSESTDTALKAATEVTNWFVLEVWFSEECIAKAFTQGLLHWSSHTQHLQWHGALSLRSESAPGVFLSCTWSKVTLEPTGTQVWAEKFLGTRRRQMTENEVCSECSRRNIPVWYATKDNP